MVPSGAAFGRDQVIIATSFIEVRRLGESECRAFENILSRPDEFPFFERIFLQHNPREAILARTMIPELVHEIFFSVVVVKQRWIEPAAVEVNWIGPLAVDAR